MYTRDIYHKTNLQTLVISAPEYPLSFLAMLPKFTSGSSFTSFRLIFNKASLPSAERDKSGF